MANFKELNDNVTQVLLKLLESQNLCKLLHYISDDPLSEPDIDPYLLIHKNIFPLPKIPEVSDTKCNYLTVVFDTFRLGENKGVKDGTLMFTVFVHNDLWLISGQLRPFSIMHEIDKLFNNQRIIGVKKLQFESGRFVAPNKDYSGYQVIYKVVSGNNGDL